MKPLVIYHAHCLDGAGAAFAAYQKFGDEAEYMSLGYHNPVPADEVFKDRDVYVLDFSFKRDVCLRIKSLAKSLHIIDHHKTAEEELRGLDFARFDMAHSGAVLAWEYFCDSVPLLIAHIEDRDLWSWKLKGTKEVCAALVFHGVLQDFKQLSLCWDETNELKAQGEMLVKVQDQEVASILKNAIKLTPEQYHLTTLKWPESARSVWIINSSIHASEIGNAAIDAGADLACIWRQSSDGLYSISLRSLKGGPVDVSAMAKQYLNGGGHQSAAGCNAYEPPTTGMAGVKK